MSKKRHPLYKGKHPVDFKSRGHIYTDMKGQVIANATGVLKMLSKPNIPPWYARMAAEGFAKQMTPGESYDEVQILRMTEVAKEAADSYSGERMDTGTVAHKWMEEWINMKIRGGGPGPKEPCDIVNPNVRKSVEGFLAWEKTREIDWIHAERLVYSPTKNHCGTIDFVARIDGCLTIGDFKTGKGIWPEAGVQAASYVAAYLEEFPEEDTLAVVRDKPVKRMILHLPAFVGKWKEWNEEEIREKLTGYEWERDYEFFLALLNAWEWAQGGPNKWTWFGKRR